MSIIENTCVNGVSRGTILGYHHITLWVGNAKQAATYYCLHLGFTALAYRGLETGSRDVVSHVIRQNDITIEFQSPLKPDNKVMGAHMQRHGDGIKDIAFTVDDIEAVVDRAKIKGAIVIVDIHSETDGDKGTVRLATVQASGDTTHTFVERSDFNGVYLPNYKESTLKLSLLDLPKVGLKRIDHWAGVQTKGAMESVVEWYENCLSLSRFWSIDEKIMKTEFSAFRSVVVSNCDNTIQLNISEPAEGLRKSQTQEFLDYYGGPGVHHFAFITDNIIQDVQAMKARGMEFVRTPGTYYQDLRQRLQSSKVAVSEDLDLIESLNILLDFDDSGYLLQIFTKPVEDRPTFLIEIIQRNNFNGFGVGNFKSLYKAMEADQALRGNV